MKKPLLLFAVLWCVPLCNMAAGAQSTSTKPTADVQAQIKKLVDMERAWGPEISTENMTLSFEEMSRSGGVVVMRLKAAGAPKDKLYSLVSWPVTEQQPVTVAAGVTISPAGLAICSGKTTANCGSSDKPDDPIDLELHPAPGEPVRLALISADNTVKLFAKVVPVPLEGKDHSCTISVVLLTPAAEVVTIDGQGFAPNSELTITSLSGQEVRNDKNHADDNGHYSMVDLPYVEGLDHGNVTVTLKSAKCSPSVTIPWGKSS